MKRSTIHEAKTHLSRMISEVEAGEEFVICRGKHPAARLVPISGRQRQRRRPQVGTVTSQPVHLAEDAFEPLDKDELAHWGL